MAFSWMNGVSAASLCVEMVPVSLLPYARHCLRFLLMCDALPMTGRSCGDDELWGILGLRLLRRICALVWFHS